MCRCTQQQQKKKKKKKKETGCKNNVQNVFLSLGAT